ncbi:Dihydroneopterin aldolase [Fulvivirga imtechensis AK7]|uniref:7,8-dihydroneopterin aldolase n=1 Tax=Fulvivirga imtechensis AK7 TaxID=1237149 RepID=L8JJY8_9BACT|nr:dihydroneopterin aldolase [Fulvivirga imtechensis]ELR68573.1 Dihydroneopterin aldolase [Fulvivirga imtechensis AK7]
MGKIQLEGLRFKAYHGYYDEEREKGNQFEVNISVTSTFERASKTDDIEGTVDYELLYAIVKDEMTQPSKLLEHVVERIADRVLREIPAVEDVEIRLSKFNPPIGGECRAATVSLKKGR